MPALTMTDQSAATGEKFFTGVLWNWAGIAVQLLVGVFLAPYIIHRLGTERYGMWALVFSLMSYYSFLDIGFRSAVVRFAAHYRAQGDDEKMNQLINTTFAYFSAVAVLSAGISVVLWKQADRWFRISAPYRVEFSSLVLVVGLSIAIGFNMSVFSGAVEGFQRFDISNRIRIIVLGLRGVGLFGLLAWGFGLIAMGLWTLLSNVVFFAVYYLWFRRIFPPFRFSLHHVRTSMLKETISYGIHTFVAGLSGRSLEQTPSLLIGYFRSAADVAYFNFPLRLLQYASNAITNVGVVALPHSAALAARGQTRKVASLGIYANRYCLVLFMPLAIFLALYGKELFTVWLKPDFTLHSAPLLPVMIAGFGLTQAAQFCSGSILFGLAKQQGYSYALFGEAVLNTVATIVVLPKYGIFGAAVAGAILMVLVRGLVTPWLLCRHLDFSFWVYMRSIFVRPLATALPVWGALYFLKQWGIAGRNWPELISAGAFASGAYLGAAYFSCLAAEHRTLLLTWAAKWWRIATVRFG